MDRGTILSVYRLALDRIASRYPDSDVCLKAFGAVIHGKLYYDLYCDGGVEYHIETLEEITLDIRVENIIEIVVQYDDYDEGEYCGTCRIVISRQARE